MMATFGDERIDSSFVDQSAAIPSPIASVRVAKVDGELIPFPTSDQLDESELT